MPIDINDVILVSVGPSLEGIGSAGSPLDVADEGITEPKLGDDAVSLRTIEAISPNSLFGSDGSGDPIEVSIGANLTLLAGTLSASGGGGGGSIVDTTIALADDSLEVSYIGASPPTFTSGSPGNFAIGVPSGTRLTGFDWIGNNVSLSGTNKILVITWADGVRRYFAPGFLNLGTNQIADHLALGVVPSLVPGGAGVLTCTFPNMNGFGASGFRMIVKFK